ncbi:YgiW/YdeI family stress tolerance OB fold protein [Dickeya chrysanthemi]|uniref:YgiW/YdeI family stress tolerance OB fold protein n=1 Tax=Dickeya chrysanthemi TaxID=556 RepID=UPI00039A45B3|nr:NirD/YgiW/YdeI family stress tolerance protein [Dickeya chrysanthemi]
MKKRIVLIAAAALFSASLSAAQNGGFLGPNTSSSVTPQSGGFSGPDASLTTVAQAKEMRDDSWVRLQGNITQRVGSNDYQFHDATGTLMVEIDDKRWEGQTITPEDLVELKGELDKEFGSVQLDVKQIRKIQK